MEVHIYSVKPKSQTGNIWVKDIKNDNTKRPKPKETQLGILKIYVFCQKIQQRALGPGVGYVGLCWGYVSIFENIPE